MADYQQRVAERIVHHRERQGLSREALAYKAGMSVKQLRRIERGESDPRLSTVRRLADALDVEIPELRPDLEAEEQALQERLDAIDAKLDAILAVLGVDGEVSSPPIPAKAGEAVRKAQGIAQRRASRSSRRP
ncbi:MAG: helix-turn-helix domain-containing protein [Actinomycetota bacterium]|nr:helix-turn-helix domain-containing protein [Actinomycetota bacterium]